MLGAGSSISVAGDSSSILSNLLAMATAGSGDPRLTNGNTDMLFKDSTSASNQSNTFVNGHCEVESENSVKSKSHKLSPLDAMLQKAGPDRGAEPGDDSGMFAMLQNICGRVSQLRDKERSSQEVVTSDNTEAETQTR